MLYTDLTIKALQVSLTALKNQVDKDGIPYVYHHFHVAEQMEDEYSICVALLYDIIQDSDISLDDLKAEGFPPEVTDALTLLTYDGDMPYMDYIRKIKTNPIAKKVKLADLENNIDLSRLGAADDEAIQRVNTYKIAVIILNKEERPTKIIEAWETRCCHTIIPKMLLSCPLCLKEISNPIETEMILENPHARFVEDYPIKIRVPEREPGSVEHRTDFTYLNGHGTFYRFDEDHFPITLLDAKSSENDIELILYNIHTEQLDMVRFKLRSRFNIGENCIRFIGKVDTDKGYFEIKIDYYLSRPLESHILVFASAPLDHNCFSRLYS